MKLGNKNEIQKEIPLIKSYHKLMDIIGLDLALQR